MRFDVICVVIILVEVVCKVAVVGSGEYTSAADNLEELLWLVGISFNAHFAILHQLVHKLQPALEARVGKAYESVVAVIADRSGRSEAVELAQGVGPCGMGQVSNQVGVLFFCSIQDSLELLDAGGLLQLLLLHQVGTEVQAGVAGRRDPTGVSEIGSAAVVGAQGVEMTVVLGVVYQLNGIYQLHELRAVLIDKLVIGIALLRIHKAGNLVGGENQVR